MRRILFSVDCWRRVPNLDLVNRSRYSEGSAIPGPIHHSCSGQSRPEKQVSTMLLEHQVPP